jgi:type IV secretory pathway TrbD component
MASFTITSATTVQQVLGGSQTGIVTINGAISTGTASAIVIFGESLLTVAGTVSAFTDAVVATGTSRINITATACPSW